MTLRIESWVKDTGPYAATWEANFGPTASGLTAQATKQFLDGPLHGTPFTPPRLQAEQAIGYRATTGNLQKIRAFWWSDSTDTIVSANLVEARAEPAATSLAEVMAKIVPTMVLP